MEESPLEALNEATGSKRENCGSDNRGTRPPLRVQIEYLDQNEAFAPYLPRIGTVRRELRSTNGVGPWFLVDLDDPLEYQLKVGEPFRFRLARVNAFLIRSRWEGKGIEDPDGTAVFVLLVEESQHPSTDVIDTDAYLHVAWGMCTPIRS